MLGQHTGHELEGLCLAVSVRHDCDWVCGREGSGEGGSIGGEDLIMDDELSACEWKLEGSSAVDGSTGSTWATVAPHHFRAFTFSRSRDKLPPKKGIL